MVATIKATYLIACEHDAVLAAVKAWPGAGSGDGVRPGATASLDGRGARRLCEGEVGTKKRCFGRTKKRDQCGLGTPGDFRANIIFYCPGRAAGDHCVGENQQLSGASDPRGRLCSLPAAVSFS